MPTYEYRCAKGHDFEVLQKMSDKPVAACPKCGAKARRLVSGGAGLLFKGDGFYITDYRSADYKKAAKAESSGIEASKPAKSEGTKTDSKPEPKSAKGGSSRKSSGSSASSSSD